MGKQARKERVQNRKNHVRDLANKKLKSKIIMFGMLGAVVAIVGYSAFVFSENMSNAPVPPSGIGVLGSEHSHQGIMAMINGEIMDFSTTDFQVRDRLMHFEGQEGYTIHRHATGVPVGYFLETLGFRFDDNCISFEGDEFCSDENNSWQFFVNREPINNIQDYVGNENNRILVTYGNPSSAELSAQLDMADNMNLKK
ncbi:protein-disulfide isomerase [Nitrosopumilus sp. b3]|uniref:protein-disulfide isomerase n=1 Tax=Nitrosopumilus sp. b3 TaxID=2109909 RepID=UPI0015F41A1D|nr:protein-disulfide isomerase [Nitrosopumilus sp. b3]